MCTTLPFCLVADSIRLGGQEYLFLSPGLVLHSLVVKPNLHCEHPQLMTLRVDVLCNAPWGRDDFGRIQDCGAHGAHSPLGLCSYVRGGWRFTPDAVGILHCREGLPDTRCAIARPIERYCRHASQNSTKRRCSLVTTKSEDTLLIDVSLEPWGIHTCCLGFQSNGGGIALRQSLALAVPATGFQEHINRAGTLLQGVTEITAAAIASPNTIAQSNGLPRSFGANRSTQKAVVMKNTHFGHVAWIIANDD